MESEEGMDELTLDIDVHYSPDVIAIKDRGDGEVTFLKVVSEGKLSCCKVDCLDSPVTSSRHTFWCSHIRQIIVGNYDAPTVIRANAEFPQILAVPLVPTRNVWAKVTIGGLHESGARFVYLVTNLRIAPSVTADRRFLGFLHPDEGRNVIRSMVYDWFQANTTDLLVVCSVTAHGYKESMALSVMLSNGGIDALAQRWTIWETGRCLMCDQGMKSLYTEVL